MGLIEFSKKLNKEYNEYITDFEDQKKLFYELIGKRRALLDEREKLMSQEMTIEDHRRYFEIWDEVDKLTKQIKELYKEIKRG